MPIDTDLLLLAARASVGFLFIYGHGYKKLFDIKNTVKTFSKMGFKPGRFWGTFIALLETVGALLFIAGVWTHLFAALFGAMMITAIFWKKKIGKIWGAYELDVMILALALLLMAMPGTYVYLRFPYSFLTWNWAAATIIICAFLAYLPEVFGKSYKRWKA